MELLHTSESEKIYKDKLFKIIKLLRKSLMFGYYPKSLM